MREQEKAEFLKHEFDSRKEVFEKKFSLAFEICHLLTHSFSLSFLSQEIFIEPLRCARYSSSLRAAVTVGEIWPTAYFCK